MHRYSTKPIRLRIPFNPKDCDVFRIVLKQGPVKLIKQKEDLQAQIDAVEQQEDGKYLLVFSLTQEESGRFRHETAIALQIDYRINTFRNSTNIIKFTMKEVLEDGVI